MTANLNPNGTEEEQFVDELLPGTPLLHGQYVIEDYLNSGGFGITYLAKDSLHRRVVIKECFPSAFCRRANTTVGVRSRAHASEFKSIVKLFVQEARNLARLRHPNIVGVHQVFEDNDTAYMALDFVQGQDLLDIINDPKIEMEPAQVEEMLRKILLAVKFIHTEGVLHRDISPDNILVTPDHEPVLIDFGAARETASKASRILTAMRVVKDGYSPQEFYLSGSDQYPCSDLYALAASIYHLITGTMPPNAQLRLAAVAGNDPDPYIPAGARARGYNRTFLSAIDKALSIFPRDRIQTAADWLDMIQTAPQVVKEDKFVKLAVDNNVESKIQDLMKTDGPDPDQEKAIEEVINRSAIAKPKPKSPTAARPAEPSERTSTTPKTEVRQAPVPARPPAPRRPIVDASAPKRTSARPEMPKVQAIEDDEPPPISLEEARQEKKKTRSLFRRSLAAMVVTIAVVWFQYGSWNEGPPNGTGAVDLSEGLELAPITDFPESALQTTAEGQGPQRPAPRPLPIPSTDVPKLPQRTGTAEPGLVTPASVATADRAAIVTTTSKLDLPFVTTADAPNSVYQTTSNAPAWMEAGQQIVMVNGIPVTTLAGIEDVVAPAGDLKAGEAAEVIFGLKTADGAQTFVRTLSVPVVQETILSSGARFHGTPLGNGTWTTVVVQAMPDQTSGLEIGDELVSVQGSDIAIAGPGALTRVVSDQVKAGIFQLTFIVRRDGETLPVSVSFEPSNS